MKRSRNFYLFAFILFFLNSTTVFAQLTAPGSVATETTNYPVFPETDNIFIFCAQNEGDEIGALTVQTNLTGSKTYLWESYNSQTGNWEQHLLETADSQESSVSLLPSGGYRITISQGETTEVYRAWIFNNWLSASAEVTESACEYFRLGGTLSSAELTYYDLSDNSAVELASNLQVQWLDGESIIASVLIPQIFNLPLEDTEFTLRLYDRFGCETTSDVLYQSVAVEADFTVEPQTGEAPLTVNFSNQSLNANPDQYHWFFYRDLEDINRESASSDQPVDSIMLEVFEPNPVYTFENSGTYDIKLVAANGTCTDTTYIDEYIVVDTSFIDAPNVFTPDGNGVNDEFYIKFWSMQSIKISIFNRWGNRIHFYESDNVQGFEEAEAQAVWDGRIGGNWASPGVYYYTVEGIGRDDRQRRAHGFFHLFRDKR